MLPGAGVRSLAQSPTLRSCAAEAALRGERLSKQPGSRSATLWAGCMDRQETAARSFGKEPGIGKACRTPTHTASQGPQEQPMISCPWRTLGLRPNADEGHYGVIPAPLFASGPSELASSTWAPWGFLGSHVGVSYQLLGMCFWANTGARAAHPSRMLVDGNSHPVHYSLNRSFSDAVCQALGIQSSGPVVFPGPWPVALQARMGAVSSPLSALGMCVPLSGLWRHRPASGAVYLASDGRQRPRSAAAQPRCTAALSLGNTFSENEVHRRLS